MTVIERLVVSALHDGAPVAGAEREKLSLHLLDLTGAMIAGNASREAAPIRHYYENRRAETAGMLSSADVSAANVSMTRLTEVDDIHMASCTTPGAVVVSTAVGLIPLFDLDIDRFCIAIRAGYETMMRLGRAVDGPQILYRGIWPTLLLAPAAASTVAATLLNLDNARTADALSTALCLTSGGPGSESSGAARRWLLVGLAARNGVVAALAARDGIAGDRGLLDGNWFESVHGIRCNGEKLLEEDGPELADLSFKPVCAAKQTIAAIQGFKDLLAEGLTPNRVKAIRVFVPPVYRDMIAGRHELASRVGRITTVAYHLALAAHAPERMLNIDREDVADMAEIHHFMQRISVHADPSLSELYPFRWPARIEIEQTDGSDQFVLVAEAEGDPGRPASRESLKQKFLGLVTPASGGATAARLLGATENALNSSEDLKHYYREIEPFLIARQLNGDRA